MKSIQITTILVLITVVCNAQQPVIYGVSPDKNFVAGEVSITGSNFGTASTDVAVFFGATRAASIVTIADNEMVVTVPSGATYEKITVTRLSSGLTAYSYGNFTLSFGSENFDITKFGPQQDFPSGSELNDLCTCDFDGDSKPDVIGANNNSNLFGVFLNTSTSTAINFTSSTVNLNTPVLNVSCGDLDGDGKPDLIFSKSITNTNRVIVRRNISSLGSISFAPAQTFIIAGSNARKIGIEDLNRDGKPELVVTNESNNKVTVLENTSTPGSINFNPFIALDATGAFNTGGIALLDLNNDTNTDIVVTTFLGANLYAFINKSGAGSLQFDPSVEIPVPGNLVNVKAGKINDDEKPDIVVTQLISNNVSILFNESTTSAIKFSAPNNFTTPAKPWGLDLGDINGDRKLDILVGSIETTQQLGVLLNTTSGSSPSFQLFTLGTLEKNRNVRLVDLSGEGKPDILFTSIDNGNISVFQNKNCLEALIFPAGDTTVCAGQNLELSIPQGLDATYQWTRDGSPIATTPKITVTTTGSYQATTTSAGGACSSQSTTVNITVNAGTVPGPPTLTSNSPLCTGEDLILSAIATSATSYRWRGPNNFSATVQNPQVPDIANNGAGKYTAWAINGQCAGEPASVIVDILASPDLTITSNDNLEFCAGGTALLEISRLDAATGATYQWLENGIAIGGKTSATLSVNTDGLYSLSVTNPNGCQGTSNDLSVRTLSPPSASFNLPATACEGNPLSLENTSTVESNTAVFYSWDFGDGSMSTVAAPVKTYNVSGTYTISLTVSYTDATCSDVVSQNITVNQSPQLELTADNTVACAGDSIRLAATAGLTNYNWTAGGTDSIFYAKNSGTTTVTATNAQGCMSTASIDLLFNPGPSLSIQASETIINQGENTSLIATGADTYSWSPAASLDDPAISNPIATPDTTTIYTVTGTNANTCMSTAEITITVVPDDNRILAISVPKLFSPNSDGIDDNWVIRGIENYPECEMTIFDRTGRIVFKAQPYLNDWSGVFNGDELPPSAYYYVLRCNSNDNAATGTVLLVR